MRWIPRTLVVLTIVVWVVATGLFARQSPGRAAEGIETTGRVPASKSLPADWQRQVLIGTPELFPGVERDRVRQVVGLAERYGKRYEVDPLTILAVVQVESRFDASAVSSKGAMGLMQLQPDTAKELAAELGLTWTGDELLFDPDTNVRIGTFYLHRLIDRFGGVDAALSAYCSGPTLVESIRDGDGRIPLRYSDRVWDVLTSLHSRIRA